MATTQSPAAVIEGAGDPPGDVQRLRRGLEHRTAVKAPRPPEPDICALEAPEAPLLGMPFEVDDLLSHINAMLAETSETATARGKAPSDTPMTLGSPAAFAQLIDGCYDKVYRYVRSRVKRVEDVEDITQQVFLNALSAVGRYEQRTVPFLAWLYTIAHNLVITFYRKKPAYALDERVPDARFDHDPGYVATFHSQQERLTQAVLLLTPIQGKVIALRFGKHMASSRIAAALGKSESNIRIIQFRALRKLRLMLQDEWAEYPAEPAA